jgi:hypothetical protein
MDAAWAALLMTEQDDSMVSTTQAAARCFKAFMIVLSDN